MLHVRRIAINLAADAIEEVFYTELDDPIEGLNTVEIQDLLDQVKDRYCHIDQADLDANLVRFNQAIDPSVPLIIYIRKQEDAKSLPMTDMYKSPGKPWSPLEPSTLSSAEPSPILGKNGIASLKPIALGLRGKLTGPVLLKNKRPFNV